MSFELDVTESGSSIDIPGGVYAGTVTAIEKADGQFGSGQAKFIIRLDGQVSDDGEALDIWAWANAKISTKSKLMRWAKALGQTPVIGQVFDVYDLRDRRCGVLVERSEGAEGVRCRVKELLPPASGASAPASKPASDTCGECAAAVSYFTANGEPFCDAHGPRVGGAA